MPVVWSAPKSVCSALRKGESAWKRGCEAVAYPTHAFDDDEEDDDDDDDDDHDDDHDDDDDGN